LSRLIEDHVRAVGVVTALKDAPQMEDDLGDWERVERDDRQAEPDPDAGERLWCIHIEGPDDFIAAASQESAARSVGYQRVSGEVRKRSSRIRRARGGDGMAVYSGESRTLAGSRLG